MQPTTFEQTYNASCLDIAQGNYDAAIARLDLAQSAWRWERPAQGILIPLGLPEQCREALQEDPDFTEEELESELQLLR